MARPAVLDRLRGSVEHPFGTIKQWMGQGTFWCGDVHLAVKGGETTASAVAFLADPLGAFPFRVTHVLTDRGACLTADAFETACERNGVQHRKTHPDTPRTDGMVERFNGRVQRQMLGFCRCTTPTWRSCC